MTAKAAKLEKLLQDQIHSKQIFNIVLDVSSGDGSFKWSGAAGTAHPEKKDEMRADSPYFIASITKIFTACAIMLLNEQKKLDLEDPISKYLSADQIQGIHTYQGVDYTREIKVYHLVSQTSGLADYFEGKNAQGTNFLDTILDQGDIEWDLKGVLDIVKHDLQPSFPPAKARGTGLKAAYSDTNYQLLGAILENIEEMRLGKIFDAFFSKPLELKNTYLFGDDPTGHDREKPATIYYKDSALNMPKALKSFWADGGMVSTALELNQFLYALFNGKIFTDGGTLAGMQQWNKLFFPLEYGCGLMRYKLPRMFSPFSPIPAFIGHSGASGSFAFFCPERDFYISGTVNQLDARRTPFQLMAKIANILK